VPKQWNSWGIIKERFHNFSGSWTTVVMVRIYLLTRRRNLFEHFLQSAMMKATDIFPGPDSDAKVKDAKSWLAERGIRDLDPVPLATETLEKVLSLSSTS
jgi:hypothetical protein